MRNTNVAIEPVQSDKDGIRVDEGGEGLLIDANDDIALKVDDGIAVFRIP